MTRLPPVPRTTPLREIDAEEREGCRLLSDAPQHWVDGGEQRIARILESAQDLSSLSDELAQHHADWIERYHLSRDRGNVVRPLAIEADARVLEIGAGCGAVTRTLGETAGLVDALEPTFSRARCAHLRTRDLPSVQVHVGGLEDVPREPVYDVIVAVGVLEYVGGADDDARVAFLRDAHARLRPGGCVVVAIENRLGVKYLAGAPEDHADQPFEGLEEYPRRGPYKTFSRGELDELITAAGLEARFLHVFPDYKLPRMIFAEEMLAGPACSLAWRAARFPSYDSPSPRPRLASELHLWRGLVHAGLGAHFSNSFVVLCHAPGDATPWPGELEAAFYTANRRAAFATESRVVRENGGIVVTRRHLLEGDEPRREGPIEQRCTALPFEPGPTVLDRLEHAGEAQLGALLERWREHVLRATTTTDERLNIDPLPDNIVDSERGWCAVDDEWACAGWRPETVLARCLVYVASSIAERRPPDAWPDACSTTGDLVAHLAALAGAEHVLAHLDEALQLEAKLQAQVIRTAPHDGRWDDAVAEEHQRLRSRLAQPLQRVPLGVREWEIRDAQDSHVADLNVRVQELHELAAERQTRLTAREAAIALNTRELDDRQRRIAELQAELERVRAAQAVIVASRSWRLTASLRRLATIFRRTS